MRYIFLCLFTLLSISSFSQQGTVQGKTGYFRDSIFLNGKWYKILVDSANITSAIDTLYFATRSNVIQNIDSASGTINLQKVLSNGNEATGGAFFGNTVQGTGFNIHTGSDGVSLRQSGSGSHIVYFPTNGSDAQNVAYQSYVDTLIAAVASGFQGSLAIADEPVNDGIYFPSENGIYPNADSIEVDLSEGLTTIVKSGSNFTKIVFPMELAGYFTKIEADSLISLIRLTNTIAPTNLFDGVINEGSYFHTTTGNILSEASYSRTNKITVEPSTTYCISGTGNLHDYAVFFDASGVFVGYQLMTSSSGGYQFTTTAGTYKVGINVTNTSQTGIENTFQLNKSAVPLDYSLPLDTTYSYTINPDLMTDYYNKDEIDIKLKGKMDVVIDSPLIYIRTVWDDTLDLVNRIRIDAPVNFYNVYLIDNSASNTAEALASAVADGELLHASGDDVAPALYNGTYIGANHGAYFAIEVTATGHGKTSADLGQQFTDNTARPFYLIKVVDANKVWVISNNTGSGDLWSFKTTIGGNLTYVSGGVDTDGITVGSQALTQLLPSIQGQTITLLADGKVATSGHHSCTEFEISDSYTIPNVPDVIDYVVANESSDFNDGSIGKSSGFSIRYRFDPYGGNTIIHSFRSYKELALDYAGFIQFLHLQRPPSDSLYMIIPDVDTFVGATKTWDYWTGESISAASIDVFDITSSYWEDHAPYRFIQSTERAGTARINMSQGYSPINGITKLGDREDYINSAASIFSTKKTYPKGIDSKLNSSGKIGANQYYQAVAFKSYKNPARNPNAKSVAYYKDLTGWVVSIDYDSDVSFDEITLPDELSGYTITVIESTAGVTVHSSIVDNGNLYISSAGAKQYAVLKLTR